MMAQAHTTARDLAAKIATCETDIEVGGDLVHVWVKRAQDVSGKQPAIVLAHGFSGVIHEPLLRYGDHFAAAGLTVVLFDYRTFGRSGGLPRQWMDIPRQQEEWRAVIDWTRARDNVDPARVAIWGSSFSGGHVMDIARTAPVAAAIAQAPFADGRQNTGDPKTAFRLFIAALRDRWREKRGKYPYYVGATGHPGTLCAMTTPDAIQPDWWQKDQGSTMENRITPRVFLQMLKWRPGTTTAEIPCPLLVQIATKDAVTPPEPARAAASNAPKGRHIDYPIEHFEIYHGAPFKTAIADQIAFLQSALNMETANVNA